MTPFSEQLSAVRKSQWEAQLDVFRALSSRALDSAEELIALNMKTSRTSVEQAAGAFKQLLEASDPRDLSVIGAAAQDQWRTMLSYGRELLGIATGTRMRIWSSDSLPPLAAPLQLLAAPTANIPTSVPQAMEQMAIATADATTIGSEIAAAAVDTGNALAQATLHAGTEAAKQAEEATQEVAETTQQLADKAVDVAAEAPAAPADVSAAEPVQAAEPVLAAAPVPDEAIVDTIADLAIADDVPPAKAKPLAKALNKVSPKPVGAEHPVASTVPLESNGHVDLPIVTPVEGIPPLRVVAQDGKPSRASRKK